MALNHCLRGEENLCVNGSIISVATNGGWTEYFVAKEQNLIKIPDNIDYLDAVSLPVGGRY
jgi:D-arabinose 1-dehydrogenase-like Zn-dependent alcohol dehydrogenase